MASNDVVVKFGVDTTAVGRALSGLQNQVRATANNFSSSFSKATNEIAGNVEKIKKSFGDAVALAAPFAIAAAGTTKLVSAFADYEAALVGVGKTSGLSGSALEELGSSIDEIARKTPFATNELLNIAQTAAQLGVQGAENIKNFTSVFAQLQTATDIAGEEGSAALVRLINLSGDTVDNVANISSALVDLDNTANANAKEILNVATAVSQATTLFDLGSSKIIAYGTTFTEIGIEAELASSTIGQSLNKINSAVLGGGKELKKFAQVAGVSSEQFARTFKEDASGAFILFLEGLNRLKGEGADTVSILNELELGGRQFERTIPTLAQNVDLLKDRIEQSSKAYEDNLALFKEFAAQNATFSSQIAAVKNSLTSAAVSIGETLAPAVAFLAGKVKSLADAFVNSSPFVKNFVGALIGIVTVSTGVVAILGIAKLAVVALGPVLAIAKVALSAFGLAARASALSLGLLTGGITIFIGLAAAAIADWNNFSSFFLKLWADIKLVLGQAINGISAEFRRFTLDAKADFFQLASFIVKKAADVVDAVLQIGRALGVIEKQAAGSVSGIRKIANEYKNVEKESRAAASSAKKDLAGQQKALEAVNELEKLVIENKRKQVIASKEAEQQAKLEAEARKLQAEALKQQPQETEEEKKKKKEKEEEEKKDGKKKPKLDAFGQDEEGKTAKLDAEQKKRLELEKQYQEQRKILQEEGRLEEVERLAEEEGLDLQTLVLNLQTRQQIEQDFREEKAKAEAEARNQFLKDEIQFGKTIAQIRKIANSEELKQTSEFFGELATLQQSSSEKLKKIGKAAAIAQTLIDTFKGAQAAFSAVAGLGPSGFALGVARAAAATASGLARVAQIKKAQKGGMVEGTGVGDSQLMALEPGEIVVPNEATSPLRQSFDELVAANGGGGGGSMQITGELTLVDDVGRFVTRAQVEGTRLNTERRV